MVESKQKILQMLAENKISTEEATRLLELVSGSGEETVSGTVTAVGKKKSKYLRVMVEPREDGNEDFDKINIRVPMALIHSGMKFSKLIPQEHVKHVDDALSDKGVNFSLNNLKDDDIDELITALSDLEVNVEGKAMIRVFAE